MVTIHQSNWLKLLALLTMLIDHIGVILFPGIPVLRIIGRVAFPIFAFQIAVGARHSKDPKRYLKRVSVLAICSQIPYMLAFETLYLNILFTFVTALVFIIYKNPILRFICISFVFAVPIEYGWYGLATVLLFYFCKNNRFAALTGTLSLTFIFSIVQLAVTQLWSMIAFIIILCVPFPNKSLKLPKGVFYWFYPIHLIVLSIIRECF